jgi:hypothetical protein
VCQHSSSEEHSSFKDLSRDSDLDNETVGRKSHRVNVFGANVTGIQSSKNLDAEVVAS